MKKLAPYLLAAALAAPALALGATAAQAQPGAGGPSRGHHGPRHGDPAAHAEHRARMLTAILDLDAHQSAEVRRILLRTATEMHRLRETERSDARRDAMRALHERAKQEIDALLNPAQRATMDRIEAVRAEHRGHGRGHHGHRDLDARPRR